jgi:IS5 family transposase
MIARRAARDLVRAGHGDRVEAPAVPPAATHRGGGCMGPPARAAFERAARPRRDRAGARGCRLEPRAGEKGGSATGPLAWTVTSGNHYDVTQLVPMIERGPPVRGRVGRPRRRPERVLADRGYDHDKYRRELRQRRITPEIARRQTDHGSGHGRARWVVERTFA